jgi:hypothetical protein
MVSDDNRQENKQEVEELPDVPEPEIPETTSSRDRIFESVVEPGEQHIGRANERKPSK